MSSWPTETMQCHQHQHHQQQHQHQHQQQHQHRETPPETTPRRIQTIVENNRKTEMCRNWEKGLCRFGERCAFAHGTDELKYRTLREMQNAGRIPDAAKYRCYPCMTWIATGSCPYASRCVFIHDPRAKGPVDAWLYARSYARSPSSAYPSSDSSFFFPDVQRDPDSYELPADRCLYELDPSMSRSPHRADRAVYNLWYSFVSMLVEANTPPDDQRRFTGKNRGIDSDETRLSIAHGDGADISERTLAKGYSSKLAGAPATTRSWPDYSTPASARTSSGVSAASSTNENQWSMPATRTPRECVHHLPVFSTLARGIPAAPLTPPSPAPIIDGLPLGSLTVVSSRDCPESNWNPVIPGADYPAVSPSSTISQECHVENIPLSVRPPSRNSVSVSPPDSPPADIQDERRRYYDQQIIKSSGMGAVMPGYSPLGDRFSCGRMHPARATGVRPKDHSDGDNSRGFGYGLRAGFLVRAGHPIFPYEHATCRPVGVSRSW